MLLTKIELAQLLERAIGKGEPLTKRGLKKLDASLIKKRHTSGLKSKKEKIVLTGLILYDPRNDCSDSKNADKRNRYTQRAWENICRWLELPQ